MVRLEPALSVLFRVELDHDPVNLGDWTKCEGLTVEFDVQEYREGGQNTYVHRMPGRCKYQNVKLTRPINARSRQVAAWVASMKLKGIQRHSGSISVLDAGGRPIARLNLEGIYPVRWTGPSLDVGGNQVATEVLELAHNGFQFEPGTGV